MKQIYCEKYKKPYLVIRKDHLPKAKNLPWLSEGAQIESVEIRATGICETKGKERVEFQDVRIYMSGV